MKIKKASLWVLILTSLFFSTIVLSCSDNTPDLRQVVLNNNGGTGEANPRSIYYNKKNGTWYRDPSASTEIKKIGAPKREIQIEYKNSGTPQDINWSLPEDKSFTLDFGGFELESTKEQIVNASSTIIPGVSVLENDTAYAIWNFKSVSSSGSGNKITVTLKPSENDYFKGWQLVGKTELFDKSLDRVEIDLDDPDIAPYFKNNKITLSAIWGDSGYKTVTLNQSGATEFTLTELHYWNYNGKWYESQGMNESQNITELSNALIPKKRITISYDVGNESVKAPSSNVLSSTFMGYNFDDVNKSPFISESGTILSSDYKATSATALWEALPQVTLPEADDLPGRPFQGWRIGNEGVIRRANTQYSIPSDNTDATIIAKGVWDEGTGTDRNFTLTFDNLPTASEKPNSAVYRVGDTWYTDDRDENGNLTLTTNYSDTVTIPTKSTTIKYNLNSVLSKDVVWPKGEMAEYQYEFKFGGYVDSVDSTKIYVDSLGAFQKTTTISGNSVAVPLWTASDVGIYGPPVALNGFKFVGWGLSADTRDVVIGADNYYRPNKTTDKEFYEKLDAGVDITFYAIWTDERSFTLTLDSTNEATSNRDPIKRYFKHEQNDNSTTVTTKWYSDPTFKTEVTSIPGSLLPKKQWNVTFNAFNTEAGSLKEDNATDADAKSSITRIADFTLESYKSSDPSSSANAFTLESDGSLQLSQFENFMTSDFDVVANYKSSNVNVNLLSVSNLVQTQEQKNNYSFSGWAYTPNGEVVYGPLSPNPSVINYSPEKSDTQFYATWSRKGVYKVVLNSYYNGEALPNDKMGTTEIFFDISTNKWYDSSSGASNGGQSITTIKIPENTWTLKYDVNFPDTNPPSTPNDATVTVPFNGYGSFVDAKGNIISEGISENIAKTMAIWGTPSSVTLYSGYSEKNNHTFVGWSLDGNEPVISTPIYTPDFSLATSQIDHKAHTITLKGVWTSPFFTLKLNTNGETTTTLGALYYKDSKWYKTNNNGELKDEFNTATEILIPEKVWTVEYIQDSQLSTHYRNYPISGTSKFTFQGFRDSTNKTYVNADGKLIVTSITNDVAVTSSWSDKPSTIITGMFNNQTKSGLGLPTGKITQTDVFTFFGWQYTTESSGLDTNDVRIWAEDPFIPYKNGIKLSPVYEVKAKQLYGNYTLTTLTNASNENITGYKATSIDKNTTTFINYRTYIFPNTDSGNDGVKRIIEVGAVFDSLNSLEKNLIEGIEEADTILKSDAGVYKGLTGLTQIKLSNGRTAISESLLEGCENLRSVILPENLTSIGANAFKDCVSLESIDIPETVTSIGANAFQNCSSLKSIVIPSGVIDIPANAFSGCTSLETIKLSDNTATIGASAFEGCKALRSVNITSTSSSLKIGEKAFKDCSSLANAIFGDNFTLTDASYSATNAFEGCSSLLTAELGRGFTAIPNGFFKNCISLKSVVLPATTTTIGSEAFSGCETLPSIELPAVLSTISENSFKDCKTLVDVSYKATYNKFIAITGINGADPNNNVLWCDGAQFRYVECTDYPYYVGRAGAVEFINANTQTSAISLQSINIFRGTPVNETIKVNLKDGLVFVDNFTDKVLYIVAGDKTNIPQATGNQLKFTLNAIKGKTYGSITITGVYDASLNYGAYTFGQLFNSNQVIKGYNVSVNPTIPFNIGSVITSTNAVSFQNLKEISEDNKGYYFNVSINNAPGCVFRPLYGMSISSPIIEKAGLKAKIYAKEGATTATVYMYGTPKIGNDKTDVFKPVLILTRRMVEGITNDVYTDNPETGASLIIENGTFIDSSLATFEFVSSGANSYYNLIKAVSNSTYNSNVQDYILPSTYGDSTNGWWPIKTINRSNNSSGGFYGITNLTAITFSKYSKLETIGKYSFGYSRIKSLILPESLRVIDDFSVQYNPNLEYIYIGKNCRQFGYISGGTIDADSARYSSNLRIIEVHKDNTTYESSPITEDEKNQGKGTVLIHKATQGVLVGGVNSTIPNGIKIIHSAAYLGRNITDITIPNTVTTINRDAFRNTKLTKLIIPDGVTAIKDNALNSNANIEDVTLPKTLGSLSSGILANCPKLPEIKYSGTMTQWATLVGSNTSWRSTTLTYVNCADSKSYFLNTPAGSITGTIYAFAGNTLAPNNVTINITLSNGLMFKDDFVNYSLAESINRSDIILQNETNAYCLNAGKHTNTGTITLRTGINIPSTESVGVKNVIFQPMNTILRGDNITTRVSITGASIKVFRLVTDENTVSYPSSLYLSNTSRKYYVTTRIEGPTDSNVKFVTRTYTGVAITNGPNNINVGFEHTSSDDSRVARYFYFKTNNSEITLGRYYPRFRADNGDRLSIPNWGSHTIYSLQRTTSADGTVNQTGATLIVDRGTPIDNEYFKLTYDATNKRYTATELTKTLSSSVKDYIIPTTVSDGTNGWWPLYSLGDNIFNNSSYGRAKLTNITFSNYSVLSRIGSFAFTYTNITSVNIPDSVVYLGQEAFASCIYLESVYIGKNAVLHSGFPSCVFTYSTKLKTITIPSDSVNYRLEDGCLIQKSDNTLMVAPVGVSSIPNSVKRISHGAFGGRAGVNANGTSFDNITIHKDVSYIGTQPWGHRANTTLKTITYQGTMAEFRYISGYANLYNSNYAENIVYVICTDGSIYTRPVSITNDTSIYAVNGVEINNGNNRVKMTPTNGLEWATPDISEGFTITPKAGTYPQGLTFSYISVKGDGKYIQVSGTPNASADAKEYSVVIPNTYTQNGITKKFFDADNITEFTAIKIKTYKITTANHVSILAGSSTTSTETRYALKVNIIGPADTNVRFNNSITSKVQIGSAAGLENSNLQLVFGTITNSGRTVDVFVRSSLNNTYETISSARKDYYPIIQLDVNTSNSKTLDIPNWTVATLLTPKYSENSSGTVITEGAVISLVKGDELLDGNYLEYTLASDSKSYSVKSIKQTLNANVDYVIPPTVNGSNGWLPVTVIGQNAFQSATLTSVILPKEIITIETNAFRSSALTTIQFGSNARVKYIGPYAFSFTKLKQITIPRSVTRLGEGTDPISATSAYGALNSISTLEQITFESSINLKQLTTNELNSNNLSSITLPAGLTTLGSIDSTTYGPLGNCSQLINVVLPSTLTKIYNGAFRASNKLQTITFRGTKVAWDLVDKSTWDISQTSISYVQCSDGIYYIGDTSQGTVTVSGNNIYAVRNVVKAGNTDSSDENPINANNNTFTVRLNGGLRFSTVTDKVIPTVTGTSPDGLVYKLTANNGDYTGTITVSGSITNLSDDAYSKEFTPQFVFNSTTNREILGANITNLQSVASVKVKCYKFVLDHPTITVTSGQVLDNNSADYALTLNIVGPDKDVYFSSIPVVVFEPNASITTTEVADMRVDVSTFKRQYNGTVNTVTESTVYNTYAKVEVGGVGSTASVIVPNWDAATTKYFFTDTKTAGITINPASAT